MMLGSTAATDVSQVDSKEQQVGEHGEPNPQGQEAGPAPSIQGIENSNAGSNSSPDTIVGNNIPTNTIHGSQARDNIQRHAATLRPSATFTHCRDDGSAVCSEKFPNRSTQASVYLTTVEERAPIIAESALTRATARFSACPFVAGLDPRTRIAVIRRLGQNGNVEIVMGLPDVDIEQMAQCLLEDYEGSVDRHINRM